MCNFWRIRNEYYLKRKEYLVNKLKHDLDIITNKIRFVNDIMNDKIIVFKKKLVYIREQVNKNGYKLTIKYKLLILRITALLICIS